VPGNSELGERTAPSPLPDGKNYPPPGMKTAFVQMRGASPIGAQVPAGDFGRGAVAGTRGPGGGSKARQALVRLYPITAEVTKSAPSPAPTTTTAHTAVSQPTTPKVQKNDGMELAPQVGLELAAAFHTPKPDTANDAVAKAVSTTGAATEVVHSGAGRISVWGPLVKMREHPGLATRTSVASEMRSTEFTMPPKPFSRPVPVAAWGETESLNIRRPHRGCDEAVLRAGVFD
jgi:hypothetical protein